MTIKVLAITNNYPTQDNPGDTPCIRDQINALREKGIDIELLHIVEGKKN